jgi:hypothetical protein
LNTESEQKKKAENDGQDDQNFEQSNKLPIPIIEKEMKNNEVENIEAVKDPPNNNLLKNSTNMKDTQEKINEIPKQPIHSDAKPTQCDKWNERQLAKEMAKETNFMKKI